MSTDNVFTRFAKLMARSFQELTKDAPNVFVADIEGDALFEKYLAAFPDGTNPIFKVRTEHDCSTCKQFIRRAGAVIVLDDGKVRTLWDKAAGSAPEFYAVVATQLRDAVLAAGVGDLFRVGANESSFGAQLSHSLDKDTQKALTWNHLHTGEIPRNLRALLPDTARGDYRTTVQVFERGLLELDPEAVSTVLSLVQQNSLYRGEEHKPALIEFQRIQRAFLEKDSAERRRFVWQYADNRASRFRNTVIGTLVQDLSEGQDLERAVKSFENKVAPQNYKRTSALITPGMVKKAMETIEALGLESALERRFAAIEDVSVNDVKWVDGSVKPLMKGGLSDVLMQHATAAKSTSKDEDRAEEIGIDDFMQKILPETQSMEILFKSAHFGNLVSITAPCNPEPKQLFRWTNDFAWSYGGNVADSIKERVKKAGGKVDGAILRVSLSWFNYDDLDLHIHEPAGRGARGAYGRIYYGNKRGWTGGTLDVDMNAGGGQTREPVENTVWAVKPPDGAYRVVVNNYMNRDGADPGFVIETECDGKLAHYSYNKSIRTQQDVHVATLHMKGGHIERVEPGDSAVTAANISQEKWGLQTEQYIKVNTVMLSPNYWGDNHVGNKHTFFVLEGARNNEDTRGFYNEFLHPRLEQHRKVFEVIADKTKCPAAEKQLSGLGFSSTVKTSFLVRVQQGKKRRLLNVKVGT